MSTLTAFAFIPNRSEATPALWNRIFSQLSDNLRSVAEGPFSGSTDTLSFSTNLEVTGGGHFQFLSVGSTPPSYVTTALITMAARSDQSDYLYFTDSSGLRSNYVIGSRAGGTADGLNIWDASGATMLASFSKQSIRFYQNVVGPVFDVGGALADTLNAATFGTGADSDESRIQAAISAATTAIPVISRVYIPASMYPYSAGSVSFDTRVQMVREGGNWAVYDAFAYGAAGNGIADDTAAVQSVLSYAIWNPTPTALGAEVFFPAGRYSISTTILITNRESFVIRGAGTKGSRFEWSGITGLPMWKMTNVGRGHLHDLGFWGNTGSPGPVPTACIQVHRGPGLTITSARFMLFDGVNLGGGAANNIQAGVRFTAEAGFDINNDNATFHNCEIVNGSIAGLSFEHSQSKGHAIVGCKFNTTTRAIATSQGTNPTGVQGGSFWCSNSQFGNSTVADIELGAPNDAIYIEGCNTETALRFLQSVTTSTSPWPLTIIGTRIANDGFATDGIGINFTHHGPVTMVGCQYPSDPVSTNTPVIRVAGNSSTTILNSLIAIGNSFHTTTPYLFNVAGNYSLEMIGNEYWDGTQNLPIPTSLDASTIRPTASQNTTAFTASGFGFNTASPNAQFTFNQKTKAANTAGILIHENGTSAGGMSVDFISPGARFYFGTLDRTNNFKDWVHLDEFGTWKIQSGSSLTLALGFSSETSLGFYRSAASTIAFSYGSVDLATQAVRLSMRTLAASALTASAANTNVIANEVVFTVGGASGASLAIHSGGTVYIFDSISSAKAT